MTIDITRLRELLGKLPCIPWSKARSTVSIPATEDYAGKQIPITGLDKQYARHLAAYIAAANPSTMSALLDELERLRFQVSEFREDGSAAVRFAPSSAHWSNELRRLFGEDARQGIDSLEARLRKAESDLERKDAEVQRLREAFEQANESLARIGDFAHDKSTGPAVPDALWEVRSMAYDAVRIPGGQDYSAALNPTTSEGA